MAGCLTDMRMLGENFHWTGRINYASLLQGWNCTIWLNVFLECPCPFLLITALRKAQSHVKAGELIEAEELYKQVLSKFPKNQKAIQGYQKLKAGITSKGSSSSEPPQEQIKELVRLYDKRQFEEVLAKVRPLVSVLPKAITLQNIRGASYQAQGQYDAAIDSYQQAIKIKPDFADAYYNMGIAQNGNRELDAW